MAAPCANEPVEQNLDIFDDLSEFECDVDEMEAARDLEDLLLSDDEIYLESDELALRETHVAVDNPVTVSAVKEQSQSKHAALECPTCKKHYKRQFHFEKHVKDCTGKRQVLKESKPARNKDPHTRPGPKEKRKRDSDLGSK